jgi:glycosyltransferase involved in cell wall biosynthesis
LPPGATILQVLPAMGNGGVERGTIEIAQAIVRAGGRALVASAGGPNVARLQRAGAEHIELPLASKKPWTILANRKRLRRLIAAERVSLVHARSRAPAWSAGPAARAAGVPFVTTYHGSYNEGSWFKKRYNCIMVSADRIIAISHFIADLIQRRYGTPADHITVIHRGADLTQFRPEAVGAARLTKLQQAWGIQEDTRVVLMPGRLTRWKGQAVLIEAVARLRERRSLAGIAVVMAGDAGKKSSYRQELLALARRHKLSPPEVILPGHCDDMPAAMQLADVVLSTSIEPEAFGRVMAEAGALGKPVIATNIGAAPEIVVPGETGWLVPPGDAEALAAALDAALLLSEEQRAAMRQTALARVRARFSVEAMCAKTLAVYAGLLAR